MIILGIESSCDETAIAILENGTRVLSSKVSSQIAIHETFGGVVPEIAAREHLKNIYPLFEEALRESSLKAEDIDLIAVTQGPGLVGALLVGLSFARGLSAKLAKPLIPVDHVHGHIHGALLGLDKRVIGKNLFPSLGLVVSGGHTNLYEMESPTHFLLKASTMDDACGESFDKVGKMLGLKYPGGPQIEACARQGNRKKFKMPKMLEGRDRLMFSYSGLKTHMLKLIKDFGGDIELHRADLCASFQEEALGQLIRKVKQCILTSEDKNFKSLIIAGGVAANKRFREMVSQELNLEVYFPKLTYCSDNAAMIAALGWYQYKEAGNSDSFDQQSWDVYSRYRYELVENE